MLLAVMESHQDMDIVERILVKIGSPGTLVCLCMQEHVCVGEEIVMWFCAESSSRIAFICMLCLTDKEEKRKLLVNVP